MSNETKSNNTDLGHSDTSQANAHAPVILSHRTALAYYLTINPADQTAARPYRRNPLPCASASKEALANLDLDRYSFDNAQIELLVPSQSSRRSPKGVTAHSCSCELPSGSVWQINKRIFVVSPELCFLQVARSADRPTLIEAGLNLCGRYYIDRQTDKICPRNPLTNAERIERFIEKSKGLAGCDKARLALPWVLNNSASPMESKLAIMLTYPVNLGGYGFKNAVLNYRVDPRRHVHLAEQDYFSIDLAFPENRVGVEYYGEEEHLDTVHDRRRLDALSALGWKMLVVDKRRLYSAAAFETAALQVAQLLGRRLRRNDSWYQRMAALRKSLGLV